MEVRWSHLLPAEFLERLAAYPVVYLPLGICEPHGHAAPFGLDTFKAEWLCTEAARRFGGIVAPTTGYHIHESGYHAPWLAEVVGDVNPRLTAIPPKVILQFFLYQLRAMVNAGFRSIVAITGHAGGNERDLRLVATAVTEATGVPVFVRADPELAGAAYPGDHAGKYELSQLLYLRPELMAMDRLDRVRTDALGRFAQNPDANEATAAYGKEILEASLRNLGEYLQIHSPKPTPATFLSYETTDALWDTLLARRAEWVTEQTCSPA